jgi:hypothetical protein
MISRKKLVELSKEEKKKLCSSVFDLEDAATGAYRCKMGDCPKPERTQKPGSGWGNLTDHLGRFHEDTWRPFFSVMEQEENGSSSLAQFFKKVTAKAEAKNIFGWLDWVINTDQPFRFIENKTTRKYTNLKKLGRCRFQQILEKLIEKVTEKLKKMLPAEFGLIFDGKFS